MRFRDRHEAGELLAEKLLHYEKQPDVLVLGLPRGGVPVAAAVAKRLRLPLDVFVVRKLGSPGHPELAMGAIASGGVRVFNQDVISHLQVPETVIDAVTARETEELERREKSYRSLLPPLEVKGKTVILVDDGIATGSSMRAAVSALRQLNAGKVVVATPTIAPSTCDELRGEADEVVALLTPKNFYGVGQWYDDFSQTSDEEVRRALATTKQTAESAGGQEVEPKSLQERWSHDCGS